jgi:hypothetical protein
MHCNCVALAVTTYLAVGVADWPHILRQILSQLARPGRVIYALLANVDAMISSQYTVSDVFLREQHVDAPTPRHKILAKATADSVFAAGKCSIGDDLLQFLQDQAEFDRERIRLMDGSFAPLQARYRVAVAQCEMDAQEPQTPE